MEHFVVCVDFKAIRVLEDEDRDLRADDFIERSSFEIDSVLQPIVQTTVVAMGFRGNDIGPYYFCASAEVEPGWHEATYSIRQTSGNVLSYTWYFEIIQG
jgi:hypothetical protein